MIHGPDHNLDDLRREREHVQPLPRESQALDNLRGDAESIASALRVAADYARLYEREAGEINLEAARTSTEIARRVASRLAFHIQQIEDRLK